MEDIDLMEIMTKKIVGSTKRTPIMKTFYDKPEFVKTSQVLTYKPTGEKYRVMTVKPGGFWTEQVSYISERDETFLDDDLLDKTFIKLTKKKLDSYSYFAV